MSKFKISDANSDKMSDLIELGKLRI